jgi:NAD+--asparagine ADP-ribosyltransferase
MDEAQAIKLWRKAAENGQPSAEFNPGEAYITGFGGVKENREKAIKRIKSSADHGHKPAQEVFGKIEKWVFDNVKKNCIPKSHFIAGDDQPFSLNCS